MFARLWPVPTSAQGWTWLLSPSCAVAASSQLCTPRERRAQSSFSCAGPEGSTRLRPLPLCSRFRIFSNVPWGLCQIGAANVSIGRTTVLYTVRALWSVAPPGWPCKTFQRVALVNWAALREVPIWASRRCGVLGFWSRSWVQWMLCRSWWTLPCSPFWVFWRDEAARISAVQRMPRGCAPTLGRSRVPCSELRNSVPCFCRKRAAEHRRRTLLSGGSPLCTLRWEGRWRRETEWERPGIPGGFPSVPRSSGSSSFRVLSRWPDLPGSFSPNELLETGLPSSLDYEGVLHVIRCRTPQRHSEKTDWLRCFCCSSRSCALPLLSFRGRSRPICLAWLSFVPPAKGCVVAHASQMPCPGCPGERWACTIWVASSRFSSAFWGRLYWPPWTFWGDVPSSDTPGKGGGCGNTAHPLLLAETDWECRSPRGPCPVRGGLWPGSPPFRLCRSLTVAAGIWSPQCHPDPRWVEAGRTFLVGLWLLPRRWLLLSFVPWSRGQEVWVFPSGVCFSCCPTWPDSTLPLMTSRLCELLPETQMSWLSG